MDIPNNPKTQQFARELMGRIPRAGASQVCTFTLSLINHLLYQITCFFALFYSTIINIIFQTAAQKEILHKTELAKKNEKYKLVIDETDFKEPEPAPAPAFKEEIDSERKSKRKQVCGQINHLSLNF